MNKKILIAFLLDETGSMASVRNATVSGLNEYIGNLKRQTDVDYFLSLSKFSLLQDYRLRQDDATRANPPVMRPVCVGKALVDFAEFSDYQPDGTTPLYDSIAGTLKTTDDWLSKEHTKGRDYQILCIVFTDGLENASTQYNRQKIFDLIKQKEATGYWTFAYLGANQDAWAVGESVGIHGTSTQDFQPTTAGVKGAVQVLTSSTQRYSRSPTAAMSDFFDKQENKQGYRRTT